MPRAAKSKVMDAGTGKVPEKGRGAVPAGVAESSGSAVPDTTQLKAIMKAAEQSGLLGEKSARIGGRISPALLEQAKKQTGIRTDTELIEFALANVALEDNFARTFEKVRGTVEPSIKLGF